MTPQRMREKLFAARNDALARGLAGHTEAYDRALAMLQCVIRKRHLREPGATVCCRCGEKMRGGAR